MSNVPRYSNDWVGDRLLFSWLIIKPKEVVSEQTTEVYVCFAGQVVLS